jgi:hypothetical protein
MLRLAAVRSSAPDEKRWDRNRVATRIAGMRTRLSLAAVAAVALMVGACGQGGGAATAQSSPDSTDSVVSANFKRCPYEGSGISVGGWSGSVAGDVSCDEAGRLTQDRFIRDAGQSGALDASDAQSIQTSDPGRFTSEGYDCATFPLPDGMGWHVLCAEPGAQISLYFTP